MASSFINSNSVKSTIQIQSQQSSHLIKDSSQNVQSQTEIKLQKLKEKITLSKQDLIQITNNQEAKNLIETNKIQEALVFLNEAEKILEYAASSGKNIERKMIISVLHNQACCYQNLWELQKCSNYIEALIFNFNSELKFAGFQNNLYGGSEIQMSNSKRNLSSEDQAKVQSAKIQKKVQLAKYYLLYCALSSQLKNNKRALVTAKKASQIIKSVLQQLFEIYEQEKQAQNPHLQKLPPFVESMLKEMTKLGTSVNPQKMEDLFFLVRHYIKVYNSKCIFNNLSSSKETHQQIKNMNKKVHEKFKNFSIGNIMQLQPVGNDKIDSENNENHFQRQEKPERTSYEKIVQKLIVFSICQFTMATELRYIALSNAQGDKELSYSMIEFKQSQTYHLLSILLVAMYIPFDIIYMEHVVTSYHGHYRKSLTNNELESIQQLTENEIIRIKQSVVFTQNDSLSIASSRGKDDTKKCSTTNQSNSSLIVSFHQEDEDSKSPSAKKQSNNKSSAEKDDHKCSFIHDENELYQQENKMFEDYYYCKKNTENDENLNEQQAKDKKSKISKGNGNRIKNKSNTKLSRSSSKSNSLSKKEIDQKSKSKLKSKAQNLTQFSSKPSKIIVYEENSKSSTEKKKKLSFINKNTSKTKLESQYFTKTNPLKNQALKQNKSPFTKHKKYNQTKELQQIQVEYFNIQDPNIIHKNKIQQQAKKLNKKSNHKGLTVSKQKNQQSSLKYLQNNLSPNGVCIKSRLASKVNKQISGNSKSKNKITNFNSGRSTFLSAINKNRQSISSKKAQRHTVKNISNKMVSTQRLKTQQSQKMKSSHFEKYYL